MAPSLSFLATSLLAGAAPLVAGSAVLPRSGSGSSGSYSQLGASIQGLAAQAPSSYSSSVISTYKSQASAIQNYLNTGGSAGACGIAKTLFPKNYVDQSTGNYTAAEEYNWSETCWLPATCFVQPLDTFETGVLVQIINTTGSKFGTRSGGGHSPNSGFNSVSGGLLIDLAQMNTVTISSDKSYVSAAGGAVWRDVYTPLDAAGIFAIGGRYLGVGVGGSTLGGGMSTFPSVAGLACDGVKNFQVVLSTGQVVNANASSNSDLWKALKGGTNNFGIVTRFDIETVPLHNMWYKTVTFPASQYKTVMPALAQLQLNLENDDKGSFSSAISTSSITIEFLYNEWVNAVPAAFAPVDSLNGNVTVPATNTTLLKYSTVKSPPEPIAYRAAIGVSTKVNGQHYADVYANFLQAAKNYPTASGSFIGMVIEQYGQAAYKAGVARGGNSFGLTADPQNWWQFIATWTQESDTAAARNAIMNANNYTIQTATARNLMLPFIFPNTADYTQKVAASFGSQNVANMKAASKKYDPSQMFQTKQGGFLVSQA